MDYHHYVAAFHLAEFSARPRRRRRTSLLWVHDLSEGHRWRVAAAHAGGENGYNSVYGSDATPPGAVEAWISESVEHAASGALRQINETHDLPPPTSWGPLLKYLALLKVNNPARRAAMNDGQGQMLTFMAQIMVSQPESFDLAQAECRRDGVPLLGEVSLDDLRARLLEGPLARQASTTEHVSGLPRHLAAMEAFMRDRDWALLVARGDAPDFVCGDRPVVGLPPVDPEVLVPLGRRTCLLSAASVRPGTLAVGARTVAEVNRRQQAYATRFVYAPGETFTAADTSGPVVS